MKKIIFTITFLLTAGLLIASSGDKSMDQLLNQYLSTQKALAADDYPAAKISLKTLLRISEGNLKLLVQKAFKATDIKTMRLAFVSLTNWFAAKEISGNYVLAFCPMAFNNKGAPWIQKEGKLANPYLGAAMLRCGSVKRHYREKK